MAAILLDGEAVAARVRAEVADRVARLAHEGITPAWAPSWSATTARASATWP
jgi:hypothetical protein